MFVFPFAAAIMLLAPVAAPAAAQCLLCTPGVAPPAGTRAPTPLAVEIGSGLDFDRVAGTANGGSVSIDPVSRSRIVEGGLSDLGGLVMTGSATVRGEPGRAVRVSLPTQVLLRGGGGSGARISSLVTDLPRAPRLGPDGALHFAFGGRLDVAGDEDGDYRGRIAISVEYE